MSESRDLAAKAIETFLAALPPGAMVLLSVSLPEQPTPEELAGCPDLPEGSGPMRLASPMLCVRMNDYADSQISMAMLMARTAMMWEDTEDTAERTLERVGKASIQALAYMRLIDP